ncbi:MAG: hypothetical protein CO187_06555 [Zetaproteobacteria bacterium CG_4_9_14_3_um_filter_53_7]|nr:MAG: hypothetical protein AUJ57_01500 [Zetaproteobacteria bacterium CG1_02_53_45]PJA31959.1 MAG: hypothetical protein CO187_06555 [Zetaproteobacteria bacterium CG_4_9_14_3_um_filter_53_7]
MNSNDQYLWPLFKAEYISRIAHIREILNECYGQGFSRIYFDRIHQEFDSINGASRVVHREDIGELARLSASYARHLRIQLPNGLDDSQLVLLEALIVLAEKVIPLINMESDFYCLKESLLPQIRNMLASPPDRDVTSNG